jgi:hypothetical protein
MEHSTIADMAGWRSLAIQFALVGVGLLSILILFSFGGQLMVAPALLPMQWLLARHTDGWVSNVFSLLGALLIAEIVLLAAGLLFGESLVAAGAGAALGIAGAVVFYRTSGRR